MKHCGLHAVTVISTLALSLALVEGLSSWRDDYAEWCAIPQSRVNADPEGFVCVFYMWNYVRVNVEILCYEPVVLVYRNLVPRPYVTKFLRDIDAKQNNEVKLAQSSETAPEPGPARMTLKLREGEGNAGVFDTLSIMIPAVNFAFTEPWKIHSYKSGEHIPPRYDFIENPKDNMTAWYGNRFATIMVMLKKPSAGGNTILPAYAIVVELEEGDAILWTNMSGEGRRSIAALHGDCVVHSGHKVTASLRIRAKDQLLMKTSMYYGLYHVGPLAQPKPDIIRKMIAHARMGWDLCRRMKLQTWRVDCAAFVVCASTTYGAIDSPRLQFHPSAEVQSRNE